MCYCEDAVFYLDSGDEISILKLKPGHRIIGQSGSLTVRDIYRMPVYGTRNMVRINPGALNHNAPDRPLTLSRDHEILYNGQSVACYHLLGNSGIVEVKRTTRYFYHIHVDKPGIIHHAKCNGGVLADVWGNDNRLVKSIEHHRIDF